MTTPINLFNDGFLIDVNVSFWFASKKLTEEDMGLDEVSDAYTLGKKYLIPREVIAAFRHVENKARHLVERNSFQVPCGQCPLRSQEEAPEDPQRTQGLSGRVQCPG